MVYCRAWIDNAFTHTIWKRMHSLSPTPSLTYKNLRQNIVSLWTLFKVCSIGKWWNGLREDESTTNSTSPNPYYMIYVSLLSLLSLANWTNYRKHQLIVRHSHVYFQKTTFTSFVFIKVQPTFTKFSNISFHCFYLFYNYDSTNSKHSTINLLNKHKGKRTQVFEAANSMTSKCIQQNKHTLKHNK